MGLFSTFSNGATSLLSGIKTAASVKKNPKKMKVRKSFDHQFEEVVKEWLSHLDLF